MVVAHVIHWEVTKWVMECSGKSQSGLRNGLGNHKVGHGILGGGSQSGCVGYSRGSHGGSWDTLGSRKVGRGILCAGSHSGSLSGKVENHHTTLITHFFFKDEER